MHVVAATDLSPLSDAAVEVAAELAGVLDAKLSVVHCFEAPHLRAAMQPYRDAIRRALEGRCEELRGCVRDVVAVVREGAAWREIVAVATEGSADLVVVGAHGRGADRLVIMGRVAEKVVQNSPVPVLTVPAEPDPGAETGGPEGSAA